MKNWRNLHPPAQEAKKETAMRTSQCDAELKFVLKLTRFGRLQWKRTAAPNQTFTTGMKGLFAVTVWQDSVRRYFRLDSRDGRAVLATSVDSKLVDSLYEEAQKRAFNLENAIAQIVLCTPRRPA
jgi:hypothetical protein